jgi:Fe-Mn family superoxide dismutase
MNRRKFFFASSGATVGSILVPGLTLAQGSESSPYSDSGLITGTPKQLRFNEVPGFLSTAQITPHHTAHYGGALKAFTGVEKTLEESYAGGTGIDPAAFETLKRLQSSRGNSVILHEYYFDGLALKSGTPPTGIRGAIDKRFGSIDKWAADFVSSAKAAAGWAVLVIHPVNGKLYNVVSDEHAQGPLWLSAPLVVLDTYEHAFYVDYQNRKAEYVEKYLGFMDWSEAERRYRLAGGS